MGDMADYDADRYDDWLAAGGYWGCRGKATKCKYCGTTKVKWVRKTGFWALQQPDGKLHTCQEYRDAHKKA